MKTAATRIRVARIALIFFATTLALLLGARSGFARCSVDKRIELGKLGYDKDEIDDICSEASDDDSTSRSYSRSSRRSSSRDSDSRRSYDDDDEDLDSAWDEADDAGAGDRYGKRGIPPVSVPRPAGACVTPWGPCAMRVPLPIGSSCVCVMPMGTFAGVAQ
jgi:hypothetical protein